MQSKSVLRYIYVLLFFPALRRLTEKARLLGYEVEVSIAGTTEARRKIAPNLTVEFVNYFNGKLDVANYTENACSIPRVTMYLY